jgi:HD superfamily phosphohydrolase
MSGVKRFRDPVHGYITVPTVYCEKFIDSELFQRLRRIEQTSMRVLFPAAHHDRFAHSLGVPSW